MLESSIRVCESLGASPLVLHYEAESKDILLERRFARARAAPVLGHLHLSDNTGDFELLRITDRAAYDAMSKGTRFAFGRGDIHLPPYWGRIPSDRVSAETCGYRGAHVGEFYSEYFRPFLREIQERVRAAVRASRAGGG